MVWLQENEELKARQAAAEERSRKAEARQQADVYKQVLLFYIVSLLLACSAAVQLIMLLD